MSVSFCTALPSAASTYVFTAVIELIGKVSKVPFFTPVVPFWKAKLSVPTGSPESGIVIYVTSPEYLTPISGFTFEVPERSSSPGPVLKAVTVPWDWPVTVSVFTPPAPSTIVKPPPLAKLITPEFDIVTLPVPELTFIPVPANIEVTSLVGSGTLTVISSPTLVTVTPSPIKLKEPTSVVSGTLWFETVIPADTIGATHWLSPLRKVFADGVPVAANPIVIVPASVIGPPVALKKESVAIWTEVTVPVPVAALIKETKLCTVKLLVALSSPTSVPIKRSSTVGCTVG